MSKQKIQLKSKRSVVIIAIISVIILGALGFFYWQNFIQNKTADTAKSDNNTVIDKYADWQTYTDSSFNYSIKYPAGWINSKWQDNATKPVHHYFKPSADTIFGIDVQSWQSNLSPKEFATESYTFITTLSSNETPINNNPTYSFRYSPSNNAKNIFQNYLVKHDDTITSIAITEMSVNGTQTEDNSTYLEQYKLIAESIKF